MTISEKILLEKMGCTDQDALKDSQVSTDTAMEAMKEVAWKAWHESAYLSESLIGAERKLFERWWNEQV